MLLTVDTSELEAAIAADPEGAAAVAGIFALGMMTAVVMTIVWYVLVIVGDWKLFEKAGKPGWHSLIPFLNMYDEYDLCWNGSAGIVYMIALAVSMGLTTGESQPTGFAAVIALIACILVVVLRIMQSIKLAKAFGKGIGFAIFLMIFERIGRIILGFGNDEYRGKQ